MQKSLQNNKFKNFTKNKLISNWTNKKKLKINNLFSKKKTKKIIRLNQKLVKNQNNFQYVFYNIK